MGSEVNEQSRSVRWLSDEEWNMNEVKETMGKTKIQQG